MSTKSLLDEIHEHDISTRARTLYLSTDIDCYSAEKVLKNLNYLSRTDGTIYIVLNSPGGCVYQGLAIYDAIRNCTQEVICEVYGHAMSMGALILQAADVRKVAENSRMMIHQPSAFGGEESSSNIVKSAKEMEYLRDSFDKILLNRIKEKKARYTLKKVQDMTNFDTYFSAKEFVDLGLADEII